MSLVFNTHLDGILLDPALNDCDNCGDPTTHQPWDNPYDTDTLCSSCQASRTWENEHGPWECDQPPNPWDRCTRDHHAEALSIAHDDAIHAAKDQGLL